LGETSEQQSRFRSAAEHKQYHTRCQIEGQWHSEFDIVHHARIILF